MRTVRRLADLLGGVALVAALLLASPGVRISRAEADFSWDPALEPAAVAGRVPAPGADAGPSCSAGRALPALPLRSIPVLAGEGADAPSSLNGRGYNIGKAEPDADLQRLLFEARRR